MVQLRSITTFAGTAFCLVGSAVAGGQASQSHTGNGLVSRRAGSPLKVLTGSAAHACSPQQVAKLKAHLKESVELAEAASAALKAQGVENSDAFTSYLGNADPKEMDDQHYTPIASLRSANVQSVTSNAGHIRGHSPPPGGTLFTCLPQTDPDCTASDGSATGTSAFTNIREQFVELCPMFFEKATVHFHAFNQAKQYEPMSLAAAKAPYLAGKDLDSCLPADTLVHEFQHLPSVVGTHIVNDLFINVKAPTVIIPEPKHPDPFVIGVSLLPVCKQIPAEQKRHNAQNIAAFALDVWADSARGRPPSAKKTTKRFEAIHQRGAERAATVKLESR